MKNRNLIIAILAFILVNSISFMYIEYLKNNEKDKYLIERTKGTKVKLKAVRASYQLMIGTIFNQIISKPNVLELYSKAVDADDFTKNEIRDSLFNLLSPTYDQLKGSNIRQFIFIIT